MGKKILRAALMLVLVASAAQAIPGVGDEAPDFTLESLSGGFFTLSEQRGRVVLINFFGYD